MNSYPLHPLQPFASAAQTAFGPQIIVDLAAQITPAPVRWLWIGYLAAGKWHLIGGAPGTGKSTLAIAIAAAISTGSRLPDGTIAPLGHVVILATEDGVEDTIVPRLHAARANVDRVHIVRGANDRGRTRQIGPEDYERLSATLSLIPDVRLVILDPVTQLVKKNGNSAIDVRNAMEPLTELAERHGFAILGIAHLAKGSQNRAPLERIAGSLAFGAVCRIVLLTIRGEGDISQAGSDQPTPCALVRVKSNIGPDGDGFAYTVSAAQFTVGNQVLHSSAIRWGERLTGSAKTILASFDDTGAASQITALGLAKTFLIEELSAGAQPATVVHERAAAKAISAATLRRAREELGVRVERLRNGAQASPWMWSLPGGASGEAGVGPTRTPPMNPSPVPGGPFIVGPQLGTLLQPGAMTFSSRGDPAFPLQVPGNDNQLLQPQQHGQRGHPQHVEQVGHVEQVEHVDRDRHASRVAPAGQVEQLEHVGQVKHVERQDELLVLGADMGHPLDETLLQKLIAECCRLRRELADALRDDDDALDRIEKAAVATLVTDLGARLAYRTALEGSHWVFL